MPSWKGLTGLLAPRWRHPEPSTRRRAAMELEPGEPETDEALAELVADPAAEVREAAAKRCNELATLRRLHRADPDERVRNAAGVRYRQRLVGDEPADRVAAELAGCEDPTLIAHIAQQGRTPAIRRAAVNALNQDSVLAEIALHDPEPELRQRAAMRIAGAETLGTLAQRASGHDGEVARLAQERLAPPEKAQPEPQGAADTFQAAPASAEAPARRSRRQREPAPERRRRPRQPAERDGTMGRRHLRHLAERVWRRAHPEAPRHRPPFTDGTIPELARLVAEAERAARAGDLEAVQARLREARRLLSAE